MDEIFLIKKNRRLIDYLVSEIRAMPSSLNLAKSRPSFPALIFINTNVKSINNFLNKIDIDFRSHFPNVNWKCIEVFCDEFQKKSSDFEKLDFFEKSIFGLMTEAKELYILGNDYLKESEPEWSTDYEHPIKSTKSVKPAKK